MCFIIKSRILCEACTLSKARTLGKVRMVKIQISKENIYKMGDSYVEQLVKRQSSMLQTGLRVCSVVSAVIITYIMLQLIGIISLIAAFAMGYGVYYVFIMTAVEYEYVLVNGELTVDTVYGKTKRKKSGTFDIKKSEVIAPVNSDYGAVYHKNMQMKAFDFTSATDESRVYIMVAPYGAGTAKVYFEPNEAMLGAIRIQAPSKLKR